MRVKLKSLVRNNYLKIKSKTTYLSYEIYKSIAERLMERDKILVYKVHN